MEAEVTATWEALKYCISQGMNNFHVNKNLFILKNIISKNQKIKWEFAEQIEDIHEMVAQINVKHILREARKHNN